MDKTMTPLDLTVTRLPTPEARTAVGRWKMFLVLLICAAPVVASYLAYYVIRPGTTKSYGELIQPQRPLPASLSHLRGQWLLASVSGGACAEPCPTHLYLQRQLRETLGKEKERLDWVWLISDDAPLSLELQTRLNEPSLQGFAMARLPEKDLSAWLLSGPERLYLIDPQGNYMMRFPPNMNAEAAVKAKADINRLLRASSFWDLPGRENVKK
jgi:hypothetical protein